MYLGHETPQTFSFPSLAESLFTDAGGIPSSPDSAQSHGTCEVNRNLSKNIFNQIMIRT